MAEVSVGEDNNFIAIYIVLHAIRSEGGKT